MPVLFFQGLDDKIVPPRLSGAIVGIMDGRHLPVGYYLFPGEGQGFRKAETIRRVLHLELSFYGRIFGFTPPDLDETATLRNGPPESPLSAGGSHD
ncbi:MAG: hypothetical protein QOF22_308 [Bradyrhizobium sp.]|nr:hypothetical protein [Bradyrhizobium sp.]